MYSLFFVAGLNGLFIAFAIIKKKSAFHFQANKLLIIFLVTMSLSLLFRGVYHQSFPSTNRAFILLDSLLFLAMPLLYLYFKALFGVLNRIRIWHFIPAIMFLLIVAPYFFITQQHYQALSRGGVVFFGPRNYIFYIFSKLDSSIFEIHWFIVGIAAFVFNLTYLIKIKRLLKKNKLPNNLIEFNKPLIRYLSVVFWVGVILLLLWTNDFLPLLGFTKVLGFVTNGFWLAFCLFIFVITYFIITEPNILTIQRDLKNHLKLSDEMEQLAELQYSLEALIVSQQIYLDPELTLDKVSEFSGIAKNKITRIMKYQMKTNFYDYVNSFRLKHFLEIASTPQSNNLTHVAIAYDSGFNTKTTFYKAFRKKFDMTPKQYFSEGSNKKD